MWPFFRLLLCLGLLSVSQCLCCLSSVLTVYTLSLRSNSMLWLSLLQMDVVYTFQTGQAAVPGALRRQPSVVSQHNDAAATKTVSSPTHVGLSSSSSLTNSAGAPPLLAAAASSSTAGSECCNWRPANQLAWAGWTLFSFSHFPCMVQITAYC